MKKLYLLLFIFSATHNLYAGPLNASLPISGFWKNTSTWQLNRLPIHGDTVLIPTGKTVIVDNIQNLSSSDIYIKIYGTLVFGNGKLWLGPNSTVTVYTGGAIVGSGSPSETLKIGSIVKFEGSQGTISGPIVATVNTGTSPTGFSTFLEQPMPVKFIGFNVAREDQNVLVQWSTAEEINNDHFEIEKSENGRNWNTIATITAGQHPSSIQSYSYCDRLITSTHLYYRIKQVDHDTRFAYTPVRMLQWSTNDSQIKINSTGSQSVYIHFQQKINANVHVTVVNNNGQKISEQDILNPVGQVLVPFSSSMHGMYFVIVSDRKRMLASGRVVF